MCDDPIPSPSLPTSLPSQHPPRRAVVLGASNVVRCVSTVLETAQLVSPELSKKMKAIMGKPAINHKFVRGLNEARPGSTIYRKSGTWRQWHADSAIVELDGRRYIAVALAQSNKGSHWLKRLVVAMDDLVFRTPGALALLD